MATWQAPNFVEPSQAVVDADLTLAVRSQSLRPAARSVASPLPPKCFAFPGTPAVFLGRLRAELTTVRSSPGLLLQCSPKFVLPVPIPNLVNKVVIKMKNLHMEVLFCPKFRARLCVKCLKTIDGSMFNIYSIIVEDGENI